MTQFSNYTPATAPTDYADGTTFLIQDPDGTTKLANLADLKSSFFCGTYCTSITISSAEMLALNTTPKVIVAAQGVGTMIQVVSAFGRINFNTTPYATNVKFEIKNDTATIAQMDHSTFINSLGSKYDLFAPRQSTIITNENMEANKDLIATIDLGDPTAGDSDFQIWVQYRVVNV